MELELITSILIIIGIDIVLGGDNAIVIALACRNLPERYRNKAIVIGTLLAILCRIILTVGAVYLLAIPFLQFVGGILLIYIAVQLIMDQGEEVLVKGSSSLGVAIKTIVVADIVMGIDNVMAVAGAAHGNFYLVIIGLVFSIPIIIWGSKIILVAMEKYPIIIYFGASILCYTAGKMIINEPRVAVMLPAGDWQMFFPFLLIAGLLVYTGVFKRQLLKIR
ncbi:TerC family protein [Sutcliffiella horikoshii]|uniref:TerC family protein n=1 Tax=Sutcliffiella horikoshii TaxID=79883 RepID=UPI001F2A1A84|nr:TerC family protein [Sutcliffiella horikoshii]